MFTLSTTPVIEEYIANMSQTCTLNGVTVSVSSYTNHSKSGSWARGFKFNSNTYGILVKVQPGDKFHRSSIYSPDHGKTWYSTLEDAKKQRGGKVKLNGHSSKEFAFDSIQKINKEYNQDYAWRA